MSANLTLGFLGAGKMAGALAKGLVARKVVEPASLFASDVDPGARESFTRDTGGCAFPTNLEVAFSAKILVLAVKPDQVAAVLAEIKPAFTPDHLLVSIAAGIALARLEAGLPAGARVVRVMPNTPALVGAGAAGYSAGSKARPEDLATANTLLSAVGLAVEVKENLLDAVTGLSGSGPAYVFQMIEALSDGGVAAGLPRDIATRLAAQTLLGAAKMVLETGLHPGALKDMVTSPGGTTIEGLHAMEKGGVRAALMDAVRSAAAKSAQLGQ